MLLTLLLAIALWLMVFYTLFLLYLKNPKSFEKRGIMITPLAVIYRKPLRLGFKKGRALHILLCLAIPLFIFALINFYFMLILVLLLKFLMRRYQVGIVPLIPGITISFETLLYIIPAIIVATFVHEFAHAIAAKHEGIEVKSTGFILFLGILPAAFIEPDEEAFKAASLLKKVKVLSAGVAANIVTALLLAQLLALGFQMGSVNLEIIKVEPNSPAYQAGLKPGDVLVAINGSRIGTFDHLLYVSFIIPQNSVIFKAFEELKEWIDKSTILNITVLREGRLYNVIVKPEYNPQGSGKRIGVVVSVSPWFVHMLYWVGLINESLAVINAAPLFITDGARILNEIMEKLLAKKGRNLSIMIQACTLLMILLSISFVKLG